jgi:hypothetical protein
VKRFHKIALTPTLSRKREGEKAQAGEECAQRSIDSMLSTRPFKRWNARRKRFSPKS